MMEQDIQDAIRSVFDQRDDLRKIRVALALAIQHGDGWRAVEMLEQLIERKHGVV